MIPSPFEYEVAESVEHAVELLGSDDAKLIAGGHSLLPLMRLRVVRPALLVDVGRLGELRYVRKANGGVAIGSLTRHHDLASDALLRERCPLLAHAASLDGERAVAAGDFFRGVFETALGSRDVLTEIRVPAATGGYVKFNRRAQDWATVAVAVARVNDNVRVGLTSMGPTPLRARAVEEALAAGAPPAEAAGHAAEGTDPPSDTNGSAEHRRHLARVLVRRALETI